MEIKDFQKLFKCEDGTEYSAWNIETVVQTILKLTERIEILEKKVDELDGDD